MYVELPEDRGNGNGTAAGDEVEVELEVLCDHGESLAPGLRWRKRWSEYGNKMFCFQLGKGLQSFNAGTEWELESIV